MGAFETELLATTRTVNGVLGSASGSFPSVSVPGRSPPLVNE